MTDTEKILSQHEVDALLSAIDSGGAEMGADAAALEYDFKRPVRLSRDQMRAFEILQESLARALQPALSGLLRSPVEARMAGVHQVSLREFVNSLPIPTAVATVRAEPSGEIGVVELSPLIAFPILERLLGAPRPARSPESRALTGLEWGVLESAVRRVLELAEEAWGAGTRFHLVRRESDPGVLPLANPNDAAVSVAFELVLGEQRGGLELCFPVRTIERAVGRPSGERLRAEGAGESSEQILPAKVRMTAHLGAQRMTLGDLRGLRAGDLIVTAHPAAEPVIVSVEGQSKFGGRLGRLKDRKAVRVGGPASGAAGEGKASVRRQDGAGAAGGVGEHLLGLSLPASVILAEKAVPVRAAAGLRAGDVLRFERRADGPLDLRVAGRPMAQGVVVRVGDRFGLRITSLLGPGDRPSGE